MRVVGILGGIASGKSLVAEGFEVLGAVRIDGDLLGHEVLADPEVRAALLQHWGPEIMKGDGSLDRKAISRIVFGDEPTARSELTFLEQLTHPRIERLLAAAIEAARAQGAEIAVVDAAVMLKAGWDNHCDFLIFVDAPRELRWKRAAARGWTEKQFAAREAAQTPVEIKRARADWIVDNSRSLEETFKQVKAAWNSLRDTPAVPVTHL